MKERILLGYMILGTMAFATGQINPVKFSNQVVDSVKLEISSNEEDLPINEYLTEQLKPIRKNFKRLNSIEKWSNIEVKFVEGNSEGGEARYYYLHGKLEKIIVRKYGEMAQKLTEYYLMDGDLSFVFEKLFKYNRPFYYGKESKEENNDTEEFDFEESEIIEDRSYFRNRKLIHQINNQDCGSPWATDYLIEEQNRLLSELEEMKVLEKQKQE